MASVSDAASSNTKSWVFKCCTAVAVEGARGSGKYGEAFGVHGLRSFFCPSMRLNSIGCPRRTDGPGGKRRSFQTGQVSRLKSLCLHVLRILPSKYHQLRHRGPWAVGVGVRQLAPGHSIVLQHYC